MDGLNPLDFPVAPPEHRFTPWNLLPLPIRSAAQKLKYNSNNWNFLGSNWDGIEALRWKFLSPAQQSSASFIGFSEPSWDCWMNHYENYTWAELDDATRNSAITLGYDEELWNVMDMEFIPEQYYWHRLKDDVRHSLYQLCYSEASWDLIKPLLVSELDSLETVNEACSDVMYDFYLSFVSAHLVMVVIPQENDAAPECQYPMTFDDEAGVKTTMKLSLPITDKSTTLEKEIPQFTAKKLHLGSFPWKELSSAYNNAGAWDISKFRPLDANHNCWGLGLGMFSELGIEAEGNKTMTEFMASAVTMDKDATFATIIANTQTAMDVLRSLGIDAEVNAQAIRTRVSTVVNHMVHNYYESE
mmetsp:Transcript_18323/g.39944  ORF Transcript_18323/g.39944 Transcript_18323/m.39944 type:complete len:358 (+) Transcript_18323:66-1139(+)|eukprot:CAMPEP_0178570052 /NCGR_PEP_ID=MMETSP0697-20121206/16844_1 /TAXON_ID=265572 /ORGANISM="Extubocellulus spinifer, Strain CCMP396" /LENGTH=357 /DNA_ID=CAMNT_0020204409 /DNA_START=65 /DNA_END=1138 /DNA_ORIENTATION=-